MKAGDDDESLAEEQRVLEKQVVESEKKLQWGLRKGLVPEAGLCLSIRRGRTRLALVTRDEERARFHLKAAWAADYALLDPYLKAAKKALKEERFEEEESAAPSALARRVHDSLRHFEPLVSQFGGPSLAKHQLMTVCGDLERYLATVAHRGAAEDCSQAERWYLRAALAKPTDGRAFGLLSMVAGQRGDSPAAAHWSHRAELAEVKWEGARRTFLFHGERCKRKAQENKDLLNYEWQAAAFLVVAKTKVSGTGGLLATAKRCFDAAIEDLEKHRQGAKKLPDRLEALRWTLTTIFAGVAALDHGEHQVAALATEALAKLLVVCCDADSTSAVLAGARYLAVLPDLTYEDDALASSLAQAANRALTTIQRASKPSERAVIALDDDAYCSGLYDAPANTDDFVDDHIERARRLRDVAFILCDKKRLLELSSDKKQQIFEPLLSEEGRRKKLRKKQRGRKKKQHQDFPYDEPKEVDPYESAGEVPSGASDSESDDDDDDKDQNDDDDEASVASGGEEEESSDDDDDDKSSAGSVSTTAEETTLFVIDAANVAMRHGRADGRRIFSTAGIRLCMAYLEAKYRGASFAMFLPDYVLTPKIVASNQRRRDKLRLTGGDGQDMDDLNKKIPDDLEYLSDLQAQGILHATPSHDYDDSYQIDYARRHNGIIVSNDRFRDAVTKAPPDIRSDLASFFETHLLSFAFVGGDEFVPNPDFRLPIRLKVLKKKKKSKKTKPNRRRRQAA